MRILLFAQLRDVTGHSEIEWPKASSLSSEQLWERLLREFPSLVRYRGSVRLARNGAYVDDTEVFESEDEVALIPPVSGG